MPRMMTPYSTLEVVITPETTHLLLEHIHNSRRIYTDGRTWPAQLTPTLQGYSIGRWLDENGDGHYDVLEVETRGLPGPRAFDATGMPLSSDNKTIVKERFYNEKSDPNILADEITTIDSSLTRPWTVTKRLRRNPNERAEWPEENCAEGNGHVEIGGVGYFLSGDNQLMPTKKDQPPPDLRYFRNLSADAEAGRAQGRALRPATNACHVALHRGDASPTRRLDRRFVGRENSHVLVEARSS